MSYVCKGNQWAVEPEYVKKLAVFCERIAEIERKKKEIYEEILALEEESWKEDFHFFDADELYYINGSEYNADSRYKDWLASNHDC